MLTPSDKAHSNVIPPKYQTLLQTSSYNAQMLLKKKTYLRLRSEYPTRQEKIALIALLSANFPTATATLCPGVSCSGCADCAGVTLSDVELVSADFAAVSFAEVPVVPDPAD